MLPQLRNITIKIPQSVDDVQRSKVMASVERGKLKLDVEVS
jgi:hypothetical protein